MTSRTEVLQQPFSLPRIMLHEHGSEVQKKSTIQTRHSTPSVSHKVTSANSNNNSKGTLEPKPIPFLYRLFFLYLEPLFAINGARLAVFHGSHYLKIIAPPNYPHPETPTPNEGLLLAQIASLYLLFAFAEGVLLRHVGQARRDIWRIIMMSFVLSDVGHLYGLYRVAVDVKATDVFWNPTLWTRWEEWGNLGLTWFGFFLRTAFLSGVAM
ncbi:hypothetical protein Plec18167_009113 [Paecilomyces lecythidis]|uniref:DUF7704 domain-containing protein n=1 Tax=Paecilomyces lecythidis TaxID=3004212 RepID=A0ABR3WRU8_9EURO